MAMFPQWPQSVVKQVLQAHAGNLNLACNFLLAAAEPESGQPEPPHDQPARYLPPSPYVEEVDVIDAETLHQLVTNLKEIVVPALQTQLCTAQIPDISGAADKVTYSLSGVSVDTINIPMHSVNTDVLIDDRRVKILAKDIDVSISIRNWAYQRGRFLRDSGSATASFNGIRAAVTLTVDDDDGSLTVDNCECTIEGAVNLRFNESRVSWVYNFLALLLRNPLKNALQTALTEAMRENINSQVQDWMQWHAA